MTTLSEAIERFVKIKKVSGRADSTLEWYERLLTMLDNDLSNPMLADVTEDVMIDYLADKRDSISRDGADSYTRCFKSFWGWASGRYSVPDAMQSIPYPKQRQTPVKPMDIATFKALYAVATHRDKALLLMMLATAARADELLQMRISEIDNAARNHLIVGKGARYRKLSWDKRTQEHLTKWLQVRDSSSDYIWTSESTGDVLTYSGLYQIFQRLKKRAGVSGRVHPHQIRHLSATLKSGGGMSQEVLRRKLGHENAKTTQRYTQFTDDELDRIDGRYSPVDEIFQDED